MKIKSALFFVSTFFSIWTYAQESSFEVPNPASDVLDHIQAACMTTKVKSCKCFVTTEGKPVLNSISSFSANGKLAKERKFGYSTSSIYYTYSGDTTIQRIIGQDASPYSSGGPSVEVNKLNPAGQILFTYDSTYENWADSMKMPPLNDRYAYKDGLQTSYTNKWGNGETRSYDSHRQLIEIVNGKNTTIYRRVYLGDSVMECYYSKNNSAELLFEKVFYDKNNSVSKYEKYSKGVVSETYLFKYDTNKKLIAIYDGCNGEMFTYDVAGRLLKDESTACDATKRTIVYKYNPQGLLVSLTVSDAGKVSEVDSYSYTFWP